MKSTYYVSRYLNVIGLTDGKTDLLFNGVNGCLDKVPHELGCILSSSHPAQLNRLSQSNLAFLAGRGHITELPPEIELERFRELAEVLHNQQLKRLATGGILLIASYNCNLACKYCFQRERRPVNSDAIMSLKLVDDIFEKYLPLLLPGIPKPCISLYGGEPFLPANETVIRRVLEHATKRQLSVVAVTNGTTINVMPDIFGPESGKVSKLQISFDGARREHDKSRITAKGGSTFDRILANIRLVLEKNASVDVRINVDRNKIETLPELIGELRSNNIVGNPRAYVYTYPLHESLAPTETSEFISLSGVSKRINELRLEMDCPSAMRGSDARRLFGLARGIGMTRTAYCMQTWQHYLVVDPFGDIYACTEEAGYPEFRIGHIGDNGVEFFKLRDVYRTRHIANLPECLGCSVALACGGQCGIRCRAKTGDLFKVCCDDIKSVILDSVRSEYEQMESKQAAVARSRPD